MQTTGPVCPCPSQKSGHADGSWEMRGCFFLSSCSTSFNAWNTISSVLPAQIKKIKITITQMFLISQLWPTYWCLQYCFVYTVAWLDFLAHGANDHNGHPQVKWNYKKSHNYLLKFLLFYFNNLKLSTKLTFIHLKQPFLLPKLPPFWICRTTRPPQHLYYT
jgi:hypothetical protein